MANFSIKDEASAKNLQDAIKAAKAADLSATKLANAADASFAYQDGDKLTIPAQVSTVISLTGSIAEAAKANGWATAYFAFDAYVTRNGRKLPCRVSAKQLYTPTVWLEAVEVDGATVSSDSDEPLYSARFRDGVKRFGEQGSLHLEQGIPVIQDDINVVLELTDVFTPIMAEGAVEKGYTALRKRESYAMAKD